MKDLSTQQKKAREAVSLLKEAATYLIFPDHVNAVYITPAQQLRNQANEIERKEDFIKRLKVFITSQE